MFQLNVGLSMYSDTWLKPKFPASKKFSKIASLFS